MPDFKDKTPATGNYIYPEYTNPRGCWIMDFAVVMNTEKGIPFECETISSEGDYHEVLR